MSDERLPKRCYERLLELDEVNGLGYEYNWVSQVKFLFEQVGSLDVWHNQKLLNNMELKITCNKIILSWQNNLKCILTERCIKTSYSSIYTDI